MFPSDRDAAEPQLPAGVQLARLSNRAMGAALDYVLLTLLVAPLSILVYVNGTKREITADEVIVVSGVFVVLGAVYNTVGVALWGRTIGKMVVRCRVVRVDTGGPTGWWYAGIRALVVSLAWAVPYIALAAAMVVYGYAVLDPRQQGLHDKAAGTVVVAAHPVVQPDATNPT
jgi:uncharacterized RDD family membrane protein YckC